LKKTSFDVFGTLLCRRIFDARKRFALFQGNETEAADWSHQRIKAEHALAQSKGRDLYSLGDIYEALGPGHISPQDEIEMELRQCFVLTEGKRLLRAARKRGGTILFVSDMYLPSEFIRQLLGEHGLWQEGDCLYVSHEHGAAKHGGLFQKICEERSLAPDQIEHVGDNLRSDVLLPRKLGIHTVYFQAAEPGRYETTWASKGGKGGEAVADAIRAARLQFPEELDDRGQAVWGTACGVAGPLFISYVLWLEKQARDCGLKRLYFISRDGLIFKKIYDRLFEGNRGSPQSRYLYGSRQAWAGVRAARLHPEDIEWLTKPGTGLTLNQFARRCGLGVEKVPDLPWSNPPTRDGRLSGDHLEELKTFLQSGPLRDAIQAAGRETRARAAAYLQQEGLGEGKYGLVDLGWFGNLQEYVTDLMPGNAPAMGFYLDLRGWPRIEREGKACAFLKDSLFRGVDQATSITLLEILAGSNEGSVTGYRQESGGWKPVEGPKSGHKGPEVWADLQHRAILFCLAEILLQPGGVGNLSGGAEAIRQNLRQFLKHPSLAEAETYGEICFVSNQEGGHGVTLAPRVALGEAWDFFQKGYWKRQIAWPPAMIARAKGLSRWFLRIRYGVTQAVDLVRSAGTRRTRLQACPGSATAGGWRLHP